MTTASATELSARIEAAVESGTWGRSRAVLLDGGRFPRRRIAEVAALLPSVVVVDDRGAAAELTAAGAGEVLVESGRSIADAIRSAARHGALVIFAPEPRNATKGLTEAVAAVTATDGSSLPVAAVMVMRDREPSQGPLVPVAERTPVSGHGALFAAALAAKSGRDIKVVAPPAQNLPVSDAAAFAAANRLAEQYTTAIEIHEDPAPREWALGHSAEHGALFFGVLEATRKTGLTGRHVVARGRDELSAAIAAVEQAQCDVVVVLDTISLIHGRDAGARVAQAVGAIIVSSIALGALAGPAAAAESAASDQVAVVQDSGTVVDVTDAAVAARAEERAAEQAAQEQAAREQAAQEQAAREQAAQEQAAQQRAAEQAAQEQAAREQAAQEQAAQQRAAEQAAAQAAARAAREAAAQERAEELAAAQAAAQTARQEAAQERAAAQQSQESQSVDPEGIEESAEQPGSEDPSGEDARHHVRVEESETQYVGITVWTDSHGKQHVISTGMQDHDVAAPDLPGWAKKDGGDHPELAPKSTAQTSQQSGRSSSSATEVTATTTSATGGATTDAGHHATKAKKAPQSKHKAGKHKKQGHKSGKHKKQGHQAKAHKNKHRGSNKG